MHEFDEILKNATANVGQKYFQLPIAGAEDPIYRERVYCYELYHQLRIRWPQDCGYSLGGEVDKSGHPLVRDNGLDGLKPDFLVHVPGNMRGNHAVLEVKPANASRAGVTKDIETLMAFVTHAKYQRGILLVYGAQYDELPNQVRMELQRASSEIEIWIHSRPGVHAVRMPKPTAHQK